MVKNLPANAGDTKDVGLIHGSGRSPGGGHSNPLQYPCLEKSWIEKPDRLQSTGLQEAHTPEVTSAHAHTTLDLHKNVLPSHLLFWSLTVAHATFHVIG